MIEHLRCGNFARGVRRVGGLIDDDDNVPRADPDRRRSAFICRAHVGLRSRRHDQVDLPHQLERHFPRHRRWQLRHEVARRADAVELGMNVLDEQGAGGMTLGRGRKDDRIASFERVDDVVCRRCDGTGDFGDAQFRQFGDDADRLGAREIGQQADGLAAIFGDLVGNVA